MLVMGIYVYNKINGIVIYLKFRFSEVIGIKIKVKSE